MTNTEYRTTDRGVANVMYVIVAMGFNDYLEQRGFPDQYDQWNEQMQRMYENGRLTASNMRLARKRLRLAQIPPEGDPLDHIPAPFTERQYWQAIKAVGTWKLDPPQAPVP